MSFLDCSRFLMNPSRLVAPQTATKGLRDNHGTSLGCLRVAGEIESMLACVDVFERPKFFCCHFPSYWRFGFVVIGLPAYHINITDSIKIEFWQFEAPDFSANGSFSCKQYTAYSQLTRMRFFVKQH